MMANQQICHFFHTPRGCRNGNRCHYLHTSMTESLVKEDLPADTPPLCIYYQYGNCRFGNECKFSHSEKNMVDNVKGMKGDSGEKEVIHECGICLEKIETYGLLIGCDHIFCIACISSWRNEAKPGISRSEIAAKRGCPTCRKHSDFVIPSNSFVTGREKQKLVEERLSQRKVTRCRDWDNNRSCRFGSHCHYAHLDEDGEDCKPRQRITEESRANTDLRFAELNHLIAALRSIRWTSEDDSDDGDDIRLEARHEDDVEDDGSRDESDQRDDDDSLDYYHDTLPSSHEDEVPSQPNPQHENGNTQDEIYYDVGYYSSGGEDDYQHNYGTNSSQNEYHDYHGSQEYYDHDDYVNGYSDDNVDVYDCHYGDDASYDAYNSDDDYGW